MKCKFGERKAHICNLGWAYLLLQYPKTKVCVFSGQVGHPSLKVVHVLLSTSQIAAACLAKRNIL